MTQPAPGHAVVPGLIAILFIIIPIPAWPEDAPVSVESSPAATGDEPPPSEVQDRAVPRPPGFHPALRVPGQPPVQAPPQPATGQKPTAPFPPLGTKPVTPGTATGPAILSGIDAANELLAIPWQGLSKQRENDAERDIRASLEGKKIAHGGANISLKGSSVAQWNFSLKVTNVGASLDFAAPPGFRTASLNGFVMEAPLNRSWDIAVRGQVEGRASVKVGGEKLLSWSPSLFPFGLRITNMQLVADARFDPRESDRPKLLSATIYPRMAVGGEGFLPVSIPISLKAELSGGKLHLRGQLADMPVNLGSLDGKFTGNLILILEPRQYEVGAKVDLSTEVFGVPQGDDIDVRAAFQQATVTLQGALKIRFAFKFLGEGYDKRVTVPLELSFPFALPSTDELNMLLIGLQPGLPRSHGENQPAGTTPPLWTPIDFATPANEIETGIMTHLPSGTVLTLDYPALNGLDQTTGRLSPPVGRPPMPTPAGPGTKIPNATPTYGQSADSAIWTGHYLAAESFRYAAKPGPEALERVKIVLGGVKRLFEVTSDAVGPPTRQGGAGELGFGRGAAFIPVTAGPGILSRTFHHSNDTIEYSTGPLTAQPCYYLHPEGGWRVQGNPAVFPTYGAVPEPTRRGLPQLIQPVGPIWYGWGCGTNHPVSRDQYVGVFMGLAMAFQNVNDPEVRATAGKLIDDALDYLVTRGRWNVILPPDNRIVPTSSYFGDFPKQLAYLRIGKTVNPTKWGPLYDRYASAAELAWIPIWFSSVDPLFQYYKFNLSHAAYSPLLFLESDPALRAKAMIGYNVLWRSVRHHKNAYFDLLHILVQSPADRAATAASVGATSPGSQPIRLADEISSLLNDWLIRRSLVTGPNGLPRNDVADWEYQSGLWPKGVSLYAALGGKPHWVANFPLPITGRIGRGMDFVWQRDPFQVGMDEKVRRPGALPPDRKEVLETGAPGPHPRREGPGVDYLLAYYLATYLGIVPAQQATP